VTQPTVGGAARYLSLLAPRLRASGHDVAVACVVESPLGRELRAEGVRTINVPFRRRIDPGSDGRALAALAKVLRSESYDIMHLNSSKAGFLGACVALLFPRLAVIYSPHCFAFSNQVISRFRREIYASLTRLFCLRVDSTIACCEYERGEALSARTASPSKVRVIYHGLAPMWRDAQHARKTDAMLPEEAVVVGTITRLAPEKGVEQFIHAAADVARVFRGVRFIVVGDGVMRRELELMARQLNLCERLRFLGWREDVERLLAMMDVFVLPSLSESLPFALLEALTAGRIVVATRVGGIAEVVDNASAVLVEPGDPRQLARAIAACLRDRARLSQSARGAAAVAAERYGADRMARETLEEYYRVLDRKRGNHAAQ
jgi:glycosyltransferase involved in cell wall biosynthesis